MAFEDLECVRIEAVRAEIERRTETYLRSKGWEITSDTVGSRWLWFKTVRGRQYGCDMRTAFSIQDVIDREEYAKDHPTEFED